MKTKTNVVTDVTDVNRGPLKVGTCDPSQDTENPVGDAHLCIGASIRSFPCYGAGMHLIYDADPESGRPAYYLCNDCAVAERLGYYPSDVPSYLPEPESHTGDDPDECHCNSSTTGRP